MAEKGAEHICFLADVNQLYDNALGIYELEVALLIAQQSQKVRTIPEITNSYANNV
jgi:elongator complex protein 1